VSVGCRAPESLRERIPIRHQRALVEGRNIVIERRALEGHMEQVPTVIQDLLRLKVEVILAAALDVAVATQRITATVPIVVVDATDEGRDRIVESLTRPGGNVTGLGIAGPTLAAKRLALIKEALPRTSRVTILTEPLGSWPSDAEVRALDTAAERLRLRLSWVEVKSLD